jgi:hypothetical protein
MVALLVACGADVVAARATVGLDLEPSRDPTLVACEAARTGLMVAVLFQLPQVVALLLETEEIGQADVEAAHRAVAQRGVARPLTGEVRVVSTSGSGGSSSGNSVARSIIDDYAELRVAKLLNAAVQCWSPTR